MGWLSVIAQDPVRLMFDLDKWQEIFHSLKQNKLRTFLTAFGVFWGIFMLIILLGAGTGLLNGVKKGFTSDVRDSVWIFARRTSIPYKGLSARRRVQFTESDMAAIKSQLPGVKYISAENPLGNFRQGSIIIQYGNLSGSFGVFGVANDYFKIKVYQDYLFGRRLDTFDSTDNRKVATIGTRVAEVLFPSGEDPTGEYINISGVAFRVIGVFYDAGWEGQMSERVYIPMEAFQKTFGRGEDVSLITLTPREGVDGLELQKKVLSLLRERHRISPDDKRAMYSFNLVEETKQVTDLFNAITAFIWFVGIGTLMAGVVGISNIMIITVKERTREIGVRKALGATPGSIVSLIMLESVMITMVAGYMGLVLGVGLLEFINYLLETLDADIPYFDHPSVDFEVAVWSLFLLVFVGSVAGLIPALRAASVTPVAAMRDD